MSIISYLAPYFMEWFRIDKSGQNGFVGEMFAQFFLSIERAVAQHTKSFSKSSLDIQWTKSNMFILPRRICLY